MIANRRKNRQEAKHCPTFKSHEHEDESRGQVSLTSEEKVVLNTLFIDTGASNTMNPHSPPSDIRSRTMTATTTATTLTFTPTLTNDSYFDHQAPGFLQQIDSCDSGSSKYDKYHVLETKSSFSFEEDCQLSPPPPPPLLSIPKTQVSPQSEVDALRQQPELQRKILRLSSSQLPPLAKVKRTKTICPPTSPPNANELTVKRKLATSLIKQPAGMIHRNRHKSTSAATTKSGNNLSRNNSPNSRIHTALWLAHGQGCFPGQSCLPGSSHRLKGAKKPQNDVKLNLKKKKKKWDVIRPDDVIGDLCGAPKIFGKSKLVNNNSNHSDIDISSDATLPCSTQRIDSDSSLEEGDYDYGRYDCWHLLRDEYAQDYGFATRESNTEVGSSEGDKAEARNPINDDARNNDDDDVSLQQFKILGTGADDISAQPHVLSPPLMDSLLNFVPNTLKFENFWLKYSLVRDGSCMDTFRQYTRAASNTILAIQTTKGDVFGSFTTSSWENHGSECFGNGESFVWKMRMNRNTNCSSLYDQAHLESEIDVYPYSGFNTTIQVCTNNMIALGGTEIEATSPLGFSYQKYEQSKFNSTNKLPNFKFSREELRNDNKSGFAIALHDDLSRGTTAPCPTFCSPSLLSDGGEFFEILNLEVWTFTPLESVHEAQKLEMRKYFILQHNSHSAARSRSHSMSSVPEFSAQDLNQKTFYRRLGDYRC